MMDYLNLGCGNQFHPEWININAISSSPYVKAHDLRNGIPYQDEQFEVVYHSHLLEHLCVSDAIKFMGECFRVLKQGGVIRVVVPDLETLVHIYLKALHKALKGEMDWQNHYDFIMLELYDQTVRVNPGGNMLKYLRQQPDPERTICNRSDWRGGTENQRLHDNATQPKKILSAKTVRAKSRSFWRTLREKVIKLVSKSEDQLALEVGRFRLKGEVHQWMYDRFSLRRLLRNAGFSDIRQCSASESYIPW